MEALSGKVRKNFGGLCFSNSRIMLFALICAVYLIGLPQPVSAESKVPGSREAFVAPRGLEDNVEFWKLIFTRYGDNDRVFHHREYPGIIYSVLDFSEYDEKKAGKSTLRQREAAVAKEVARIRSSLQHLGKGGNPRNSFERDLVEKFKKVPGRGTAKYRQAAEQKMIRYQRGIKERFREGLERSGRYLYALEMIFASEGLPLELCRLPLVESSFNYEAYSSVGAAGIWQFMRATGRKYMRIDNSIDERRDPIIATRAAAKYLKHAYSRLNEWPLAVTSYNHGLQGVLNAVNATGSKELGVIVRNYKGKSFGFASGNFYASFIAALYVDKHALRYFPDLKRETPWRFDEVKLGRALTFKQLAQFSGTSTDELQRLNLAFRNPVLRGNVRIPAGSVVKVHAGHGPRLIANVSKSSIIPLADEATLIASRSTTSNDDSGLTYLVRRGDTVSGIASKFSVSSQELLAENNLRNPNQLQAGRRIRIPVQAAIAQAPEKVEAPQAALASVEAAEGVTVEEGSTAVRSAVLAIEEPGAEISHKVQPGETVGAIASRYKVSSGELMLQNNIRDPRRLRVGQVLKIPVSGYAPAAPSAQDAPVALATAAALTHVSEPAAKRRYVVKAGDTITGIARRFSVSQAALQKTNGIRNVRSLQIGQELIIPDEIDGVIAGASASVPVYYTVQRGDTLYGIARKHGVSLNTLKQLNSSLGSTIYPGQKLRIE